MIQRKKNIAGFVDGQGRFRPIRSPQFVGTPKRKARAKDIKKYSRAKAGDLGKKRQARAREDVFDRAARLHRESEAKERRIQEKIEREIAADIYGESGETSKGKTLVQFVRAAGGIRPTRGKRGSAGDVESLTYKECGKRGLVSDKATKDADYMFQAARESGYDVTSIDDMIDKLDDEVRGGNVTYKTHGYLDYRDNPSGLHVVQITPQTFGVFLNKYLLRRFRTKTAATLHLIKLQGRIKRNPASAATLAKAAIGVFDANSDGKVSRKDIRILKKSAPKKRTAAKRKKATKNPAVSAAEFARLLSETRRLASRKKNGLLKRNPVGYFVGVDSLETLKKKYRELAKKYHPDKPGGDLRKMQQLTADYEKAHKLLLNNEGNAARATAERAAAVPLREAIEFAVTLPENINVVIRGLWLWLEGNTFAAKDQIKSFKASDGNHFKWASKKKAWFFAAVPSSNRRGEMSFDEIDRLHGRELVNERKRRIALNPSKKKKNPVDPIMAFAAGASGILSALQIKAMMKKRKARRGTTPAKSNPGTFPANAYTQTIKFADGRVRSVHVIDSKTGKPVAKYKSLTAAKSFATKNGIRLETNPKAAKRKNPKTTARRRTYEMFQGRKAENMIAMPVSSHAPSRLDQLGDLIELKLNGGQVLNFSGKKFKLCAAGGKLWIAGGKFAKSNPADKSNVLNPIAEIDHVVYGTFKPHHGDMNYTHYIHKLGEESGHKPVLAVDREGFPVIRGGRYKIEARGIVN